MISLRNAVPRGMGAALIGMAMLTAMDAIAKLLAATYSTEQIVFFRFALAALFCLPVVLVMRVPRPTKASLRRHAVRALLLIVTTYAFFYAVGRLPLTDVFLLSFTAPLFIVVFGALLLKESIGGRVIGAIALSIIGIAVILAADTTVEATADRPALALMAALAAPATYALSIVLLRLQAATEPLPMIVALQSGIVALILLAPVSVDWIPPKPGDFGLIISLGVLATLGYLCLVLGLRHLTTVRFSLVEYTAILWATLFGTLFFDEVPSLAFWTGAAFVLTGCLVCAASRGDEEH